VALVQTLADATPAQATKATPAMITVRVFIVFTSIPLSAQPVTASRQAFEMILK